MKRIAAAALGLLMVTGTLAAQEPDPAAAPPPPPGKNWKEKAAAQKTLLNQPWARDPFSPPENKDLQPKDRALKLTGLFVRSGKKIAVINSSFVKEGDTLQGITVLKIEDDRVLVNRDGKEYYLRIAENEKRTESKPV